MGSVAINVNMGTRETLAGAYGKAGNGNEIENGNGNWKQKWECNLLAVVVLEIFMCCRLSFLGIPDLSQPPVFACLLG